MTPPIPNRYREGRKDATNRVRYALFTGQHTNPFAADDPRHARFKRELAWYLEVPSRYRVNPPDRLLGDEKRLILRDVPDPGPVVPFDQLGG